MNPPFKNSRQYEIVPPDIECLVVEDVDGNLDKAFDLLFEEVLKDRKKLVASKKLPTPVMTP